MGVFDVNKELLLSSIRGDPENFVRLLEEEIGRVDELFQAAALAAGGEKKLSSLSKFARRNRDVVWKVAREFDAWNQGSEGVEAVEASKAQFLSPVERADVRLGYAPMAFLGGTASCLLVLFVVILITHANAYDYFLWMPAHRVFRMFILLSLYIFSLAVDAKIFSAFLWSPSSDILLPFRDLAAIAFQICSITLALTCAYLIHGRGDLDRERAADYWLVALVGVQLLYLVNPFPLLYRDARVSLLRALGRIALSPFSKPDFFTIWLADQFCSLIVILSDFGYTLCYFIVDAGRSKDTCTAQVDPWLRSAVACIPFWFRLMQCARRFWDDGYGYGHLANAGKYGLSLCVASFATLHALTDGFNGKWDAFRILWLIFGVLATVASAIWDVTMDFSGVSRRNRYFPKWCLGIAVASNSLLRCAWLFTVAPLPFAGFMYERILEFSLGFAEILRRAQWNVYRIANEHVQTIERTQKSLLNNHLN